MTDSKTEVKTKNSFGRGQIHSSAKKDCYVYSTLTAPQLYRLYDKPKDSTTGKRPGAIIGEVFLAGGANLVDKKHMITPKGVLTMMAREEWDLIQKVECAQVHIKNGYLIMEEKGTVDKEAVDKVAEDMNPADKSAPITKETTMQKTSEGEDITVSTGAADGAPGQLG